MIRHIVLVRFAEGVTDAGKQEIYDALGALRGHLPGVLDFHHGPNVSVEGPMTKGYQDGFWFDFTDAEARNTYLDDPGHKAAGAKLVAAAEGGREGLVVFDIELPS